MDVLLYDFPLSICCQMVRLTLAEKGVPYTTRTVDISDKAREQFEPWYLELNPKGVVPTLAIGDEIVTNTHDIVRRIDRGFDGPSLTPSRGVEVMDQWMKDIMDVHYGVLLYSRTLDANRVSPTVAARLEQLLALREARPESADFLDGRIAGNRRFQATLADAAAVERHTVGVRELVGRLDATLRDHPFVAGPSYTLADPFATAALARLEMHGFASWWNEGALPGLDAYYARIQSRPSWREAGVINAE